jgi:Phage integrase family.
MKAGVQAFSEAKSFEGRGAEKNARLWAANREAEVKKLLANGKSLSDLSIAQAMARYLKEHENVPKPLGKTKRGTMRLMSEEPILSTIALAEITASDILNYLRKRHDEDNAKPATVLQDLAYIRVLAKYARVAWSIPVNLQEIEDASGVASQLGIVDRSTCRDRRPTYDELQKICSYKHREKNGKGRMSEFKTPLDDIVLFAVFSARRLGEIVRLEWNDLDALKGTILVKDMKHPRKKIGNNMTLFLPRRAIKLIEKQPKVEGESRIFPYAESTIGAAFQRACRWADIEDLTFHDLRHEGVSHLFELQLSVPEVSMVSGHRSWSNLARYTHLTQAGYYDKYSVLGKELGEAGLIGQPSP